MLLIVLWKVSMNQNILILNVRKHFNTHFLQYWCSCLQCIDRQVDFFKKNVIFSHVSFSALLRNKLRTTSSSCWSLFIYIYFLIEYLYFSRYCTEVINYSIVTKLVPRVKNKCAATHQHSKWLEPEIRNASTQRVCQESKLVLSWGHFNILADNWPGVSWSVNTAENERETIWIHWWHWCWFDHFMSLQLNDLLRSALDQ